MWRVLASLVSAHSWLHIVGVIIFSLSNRHKKGPQQLGIGACVRILLNIMDWS